ncbi:MAG: ATP-binding protein, partial [Lamprocystis purpurea]|nr:ATP-binding protein [Lamprocystis purpurea]
PNALFLSAAVQLRHQQLGPLYGWFRNLQAVNIEKGGRVQPADRGSEYRMVLELRDSKDKPLPQRLASFVELLRAADVGIMDLKTEETDQGSGVFNGGHREIRLRVLLRHRNAAEETWLPLEQESQGTRTLYQMGNILLDVLGNGGLLLVDELEAHLHPILALQILRQFNDTSTNSHNAQILFTTHDTHLLGTMLGDAPLRRDQVWLTEKDSEGATCLYPLTDYKPQPSENLERGYLQGRYGAIPFLGDLVKSRNPADGE